MGRIHCQWIIRDGIFSQVGLQVFVCQSQEEKMEVNESPVRDLFWPYSDPKMFLFFHLCVRLRFISCFLTVFFSTKISGVC